MLSLLQVSLFKPMPFGVLQFMSELKVAERNSKRMANICTSRRFCRVWRVSSTVHIFRGRLCSQVSRWGNSFLRACYPPGNTKCCNGPRLRKCRGGGLSKGFRWKPGSFSYFLGFFFFFFFPSFFQAICGCWSFSERQFYLSIPIFIFLLTASGF
jgi:hypothetical protein